MLQTLFSGYYWKLRSNFYRIFLQDYCRTLLLTLLLTGSSLSLSQAQSRYVDPFIGTSASGHTFPGAAVPFGMVQLSPETGNFDWAYCSGYRYEDTTIKGFAHTHLNGTGGSDLGDLLFFPFQGAIPDSFASPFAKATEKASPGAYEVILSRSDIKVELTASAQVGLHRYTFREAGNGRLLIDLQSGLVDSREELGTHVTAGKITVVDAHTITGYASLSKWVDRKFYFKARFARAFSHPYFLDSLHRRRLILDFKTSPGQTVEARVGISGVDAEGAAHNLAAINNSTFDDVRQKAARSWDSSLSSLKAEGTETQLTAFYTSLYHALLQPNNIADADGRFRGPDGGIHRSAGGRYYSTFSLWDTYRAAHPLYTLICPERDGEMVASMLQHFRVMQLLPVWTLWGKETFTMIGNHSIPVIVDACLKNLPGFDKEEAFKAIKWTLTHKGNPKYDWALYMRYGYLPCDSLPEASVSRTLEAAYDDGCAALLAHALHKPDDEAYFTRRSRFYTHLFDSSTTLMRGRKSDGQWVRPFANLDSGQLSTGGHYTEGNAWQYTWQVQQDIPGLIKLMGGEERFAGKLDSLFSLPTPVFGAEPSLDVTGLIGQYAHGNEPDHHVAYLYTLAGYPAKTQERVRQIAEQFYKNKPEGLSGNDDCGQMSAWYLFTAMGFYPVNPVDGRYVFGAPQLDRISIRLPGDKHFIIEARHLSPDNKYVQSVLLNEEVYTKDYINHSDIIRGGNLVFIMGDKPVGKLMGR